MGRRNARGLELSFKPLRGSRGRGRWYKKIGGKPVYFGYGDGVTDRASYQAAQAGYRRWLDAARSQRQRGKVVGLTRRVQFELSPRNAEHIDLPKVRDLIDQLEELGGSSAKDLERCADFEERRRLLGSMNEMTLEELRQGFAPAHDSAGEGTQPPKTTEQLLDEFLAVQRKRMERRQQLDKLREQGRPVREPPKENLSPARFASIARDVAAMKKSVGREVWDGTEACAARIIRKFREESEPPVLDGTQSPHTFNDLIKAGRMFCAWAESTYQLDRVPRERALFSKYSTFESKAKAIPLATLRKLWTKSDAKGRCWLLLGLNCGYYAVDISNLKAEMVRDGFLDHIRQKTGVHVRYSLWPITQRLLKKFLPKSGRVFSTADTEKPLVHFGTLKKSGEPVRIDNVRNWFFRLCKKADVVGYSFGNVRDTAASHVEQIDRSMSDLFTAHRDKRMAALYIDGKMVDPTPLKNVTDRLAERVKIWTAKKDSEQKS